MANENLNEKTLLTEEGLNKLNAELRELIDEKRPTIIKAIQEAREQGDLSENADYAAAKNEQGEIDIENNKDIKYEFISRKDRIHYYDITNLQNSLWEKNKDSLKILENKDEQWIFSSGNEDKLIKIWKFK